MDAAGVIGCFRDRSILITGSTGFLGKMLVEKILRVQPDVRKLYLIVRAADTASAENRVLTEIFCTGCRNKTRSKHGADFNSFITNKITALPGDIIKETCALRNSMVEQIYEEIHVIVSVAATTSLYERYDVALASNTLGVAHVCDLAKKCANLKMLLHVSTAFVAGEQEGLLVEKPLDAGKALRKDYSLDIQSELKLVESVKSKLRVQFSDDKIEKRKMKELGLKRTMDMLYVAYNDQKLQCFIFNRNVIIDVIPGDMVINALMVAMALHWEKHGTQAIYHVTSGHRNPLRGSTFLESFYEYFHSNPRVTKDGRIVKHGRVTLFKKYTFFSLYMILRYKLALEAFHVMSVFGHSLSQHYNKLNRGYKFLILIAKLYAPYAFFKGCFDDTNMKKLWAITATGELDDGSTFDCDPACIDCGSYLINTHIPAALMYASNNNQMKKAGSA
ncbi:hypothetical protein CFC21_100877 [Triticum aestivum]|uniref:Fatty acyl-CoA reductase n=2 Tax=Triticum aestivum TaxID=4565 RepID=A0A3B6RTD3_WHEAT|nr:hypothetical protein CFC21_100877 [Triticum aestivum]